jgi:hypothetical protein
MRPTTFPLPQARQLVRARICSHCPRATPLLPGAGPEQQVRECEAGCELFVALPSVARLVALRDPLLRSPAQTVESVIEAGKRGGPLRQFRDALVPILVRLAR